MTQSTQCKKKKKKKRSIVAKKKKKKKMHRVFCHNKRSFESFKCLDLCHLRFAAVVCYLCLWWPLSKCSLLLLSNMGGGGGESGAKR